DKDGNIIAYSNGQVIMNSVNGYIADTINYSYDLPWHCREWEYANAGNSEKALPTGMLSIQGVIIVNIGELYYCFYVSYDYCKDNFYKLLYSKFIINDNNPNGKLLEKDYLIFTDSLSSSIQLIRHGNGRDWWLVGFKSGFEN